MFPKLLKAFGIAALIVGVLLGGIEVWVSRNQEKIFRKIQAAVNENLNGNLAVGRFKFRPFIGGFGLNFTLSDVTLTDTLYNTHKTPFLQAGTIHVALDLNGIFSGNFKVENLVLKDGGLRIFVRKDGYSNLSIFSNNKKKKDNKSEKGIDEDLIAKLQKLRFINYEVTYSDSTTAKEYGAILRDVTNELAQEGSQINGSFRGNVFFKGLIFKPARGGFLVNQETDLSLVIAYDQDSKQLRILPSTLQNATQDVIGIKGNFDLADSVKKFSMFFDARKIQVANALPLLPKIVSAQIDSIGIKTRVDTEVKLVGKFGPMQPRLDVHFKTDTFNYDLPVGNLKEMVADGHYTNQADTTQIPNVFNTRLTAPSVKGFFESLPFNFKLTVNNFRDPRAVLDGYIKADSISLDGLLDPRRYRFNQGSADIEFHFDGNLKRFYNPGKDKFDGQLWGKASIKDVAMDYLPRKVHLKKITGEFMFNEKAMVFPGLSFHDGQNMLYVKGKVMDLIPYLFGSPKPLRALVDINIPSWQLNWLEPLLASRGGPKQARRKKLKLTALLDDVIDNMSIAARLRSGNLKYKSFKASNVMGDFEIIDNSVRIKSFSMNAFGKGHFEVSGELDNSGKNPLPHVALRGNIRNANVNSVFSSFNDFGQKSITDANIRGLLNTSFNFQSRLNNNVRLVPSSMQGEVHMDLRNAYILNFEPFLKMKKLIFKNRNFEKVQLAPIVTDFKLSGEEIEIRPLEIESNVMTLYIDGVYSFGRKTNINIQIPLSNLKKRDSTYVLNPNDPKTKEGSNIYLRAVDEGGEVNFKLAFRKKKDKPKDTEQR